MLIFFLTFAVLLSVIVAMSVGVLMGRKPIKGSCGGMSALGMETSCEICGGDKAKCETETKAQSKSANAVQTYDARQGKLKP